MAGGSNSAAHCWPVPDQVFRRDSPGKAAQWLARPIRESWGVLWLGIRLLSMRADVSSSVIKAWDRLYCIPLPTCQHGGAVLATTRTSPTSRWRPVTPRYSSFKRRPLAECRAVQRSGWNSSRVGFLFALTEYRSLIGGGTERIKYCSIVVDFFLSSWKRAFPIHCNARNCTCARNCK
jgi:hypothetical protein